MIRSILLVEDLPFTRTMTRRILSALGRDDVVEASDGREAIDLLDQPNEIDVILADIAMPGISGSQLLEMIRAGKTLRRGIYRLSSFPVPWMTLFITISRSWTRRRSRSNRCGKMIYRKF